jgi:8-amino-7-oxononanoate synthase
LILDRLQNRLAVWREDGLYRDMHCLTSPMQSQVVNREKSQRVFCSSNYLGLANHPRQKTAMVQAVEQYGVGAGASHLVVGYTKQHQQAEEAFAAYYGFEKAMLFSCGYMANLGIQQVLLGRNDVVYQDRLNHASLLDGAKLSGAKLKRFNHLDYDHLESLLRADAGKEQLVVTDTVFSMQGDEANLTALTELRKKYGFALVIDDAHGVGVVGENGRGSLDKAGLVAADVDLLVCPLGKGFGSFGAMVMGAADLISALRQFTRSYVYTTAMPAALAAVAQEALQIMGDEGWRYTRLRKLIAYFKAAAGRHGIVLLPSDSAIQALVVGGVESCCRLSAHLSQLGFLVTAIRQPTVPAGSEQLRFTLNVGQSEEDIDQLMVAIEQGLSDA